MCFLIIAKLKVTACHGLTATGYYRCSPEAVALIVKLFCHRSLIVLHVRQSIPHEQEVSRNYKVKLSAQIFLLDIDLLDLYFFLILGELK